MRVPSATGLLRQPGGPLAQLAHQAEAPSLGQAVLPEAVQPPERDAGLHGYAEAIPGGKRRPSPVHLELLLAGRVPVNPTAGSKGAQSQIKKAYEYKIPKKFNIFL